ncbi:hypothetical protein QVD17_03864 [Tagetes erecta]|uniref:Uncharacterized protein n=1 Tax=Tagetes erecta TaxID=13708 RepID=A0AAD8PA98_TARER|nr:hypothetical protein QVD17_03864 [Tagetes erecta]
MQRREEHDFDAPYALSDLAIVNGENSTNAFNTIMTERSTNQSKPNNTTILHIHPSSFSTSIIHRRFSCRSLSIAPLSYPSSSFSLNRKHLST